MIGLNLISIGQPGSGGAITRTPLPLLSGWLPGNRLIASGGDLSGAAEAPLEIPSSGDSIVGQYVVGTSTVLIPVSGDALILRVGEGSADIDIPASSVGVVSKVTTGSASVTIAPTGAAEIVQVVVGSDPISIAVSGFAFAGIPTGNGRVKGRYQNNFIKTRFNTSNIKGRLL